MEYQEIFKTAAMESNLNMLAKYDALNRVAFKTLIDGGTKLKAYPPEILQAAQKSATAYYAEESSKSPAFKKVYDRWNQFRIAISAWNKINELSYASFVNQ